MVAPLLQGGGGCGVDGCDWVVELLQSVQQSAETERTQPAGAEVTARCLALSRRETLWIEKDRDVVGGEGSFACGGTGAYYCLMIFAGG